MNILSYMVNAFYVFLVVVMIAATEILVIMFGSILLTAVIDTYLFPTLTEEWATTIAMFASAFMVGMLTPYFARGKWPYSHLLTFIALTSAFYLYAEVESLEYLFVFMIACSIATGLWMGSVVIQRHIRMPEQGGSFGPVMATDEAEMLPFNAVRRIRCLLVGTAIFSVVVFICLYALDADQSLRDAIQTGYSVIMLSLCAILLPYLPVILLTYTSSTYCGGRHATLFQGGRVFLYITVPFVVLIIIAALVFGTEGSHPEFFMLYGLLNLLQWVIVLSILYQYDMAASLAVYTRIKKYIGRKTAPENTTSNQLLNESGLHDKKLTTKGSAFIKNMSLMTFGAFAVATLVYWYMAYEDPTDRFIRAAAEGQNNTVVTLLNNGVDVNAKQSSPKKHRGWTALMWAASNGHPKTIDTLLRNGASVDARNWFNSTPLMAAAQQGNIESVEILIKAGANVNAQENDGDAAITHASRAGNTDAIKLLLEAGAYVNVKSSTSFTPLMAASGQGRYDAVKHLLANYADSNAQEDDGWTALMLTAKYGHEDIVYALLENGADVDAKRNDGWTALFLAARYAQKDVVIALLANGADVDVRNKNGWTALIPAAGEGHEDIVKTLLDSGADADTQDVYGSTALFYAALNDHANVTKVLLSAGADVNLGNKNGVTALILAAEEGKIEIVELLLSAGADIKLKNSEGRTALISAQKNNHNDIVYLLEQEEANE